MEEWMEYLDVMKVFAIYCGFGPHTSPTSVTVDTSGNYGSAPPTPDSVTILTIAAARVALAFHPWW